MSEYVATPTEEEFLLSDKYVRLIAGPIGSGKSVTCTHELARLACLQAPDSQGRRRTRHLIVRNTADQLTLTTRKTVFDWLPPGLAGTWKATEKTFVMQARLEDSTIVESEFLFIALDTPDDVRKALSLEATCLWGNECRELDQVVVEGLLGRINRFPSMRDGGATRACAIFDTNMPDEDTWWWQQMMNPPKNWSIHIQPPAIITKQEYIEKYGDQTTTIELLNKQLLVIDPDEAVIDKDLNEWVVNPAADNLPNLAKDYYTNQIPGKTDDWLRVYLRSKYGRSLSGTPVYEKSFTPDFHISKEPLRAIRNPAYPIIIGIDFGRTPAAVFKQRDARGRVLTLSEVTAQNMGVETFIKHKLKPHISRYYAGNTFVAAPDPAGFFKQQLNEMTLVDQLKKEGFKCERPPSNLPEIRIQAVERLLAGHLDGKAMYLVDPNCEMLIKGFRYGYRYKIKKNGELEDKPDKNEFSHVHDANQYADAVIDVGVRGVGIRGHREIKKVAFPT